MAARIELIFRVHISVDLLRCEIRVPPKIRVFSSGTLSQTMDLENFATAHTDRVRVWHKQRQRAV